MFLTSGEIICVRLLTWLDPVLVSLYWKFDQGIALGDNFFVTFDYFTFFFTIFSYFFTGGFNCYCALMKES